MYKIIFIDKVLHKRYKETTATVFKVKQEPSTECYALTSTGNITLNNASNADAPLPALYIII